jgi:hypothetical protein
MAEDLALRSLLRSEAEVMEMIRSGRGYLSTGEVARLYRVDRKTAGRWANTGKVECEKTRGGRKRFPAGQFWEVFAFAQR